VRIQPGSTREAISDNARLKYSRIALILIGVIFLVRIYPPIVVWPPGWSWHTRDSNHPLMIVGIYATLGVIIIMTVREPLENLSLIWFTVWSSLVHAAIMTVQVMEVPEHCGHLLGDVPAASGNCFEGYLSGVVWKRKYERARRRCEITLARAHPSNDRDTRAGAREPLTRGIGEPSAILEYRRRRDV
jgi:hypothetical protein